MTTVPLRPSIARWLHDDHAARARHLRAMASEQRGNVGPHEDAWWREARLRSADELNARADEEDNAARRWAPTTETR